MLSSTLLSYTPTHTCTHIYTRHVSSPWMRWSRSPTGEWMPLSTVWDVGLPSVHISVSLRSQVSLIACSMEMWEDLACLRRLMTYWPLTVLSLMAAVVILARLHRFSYERGLQFPLLSPQPPRVLKSLVHVSNQLQRAFRGSSSNLSSLKCQNFLLLPGS